MSQYTPAQQRALEIFLQARQDPTPATTESPPSPEVSTSSTPNTMRKMKVDVGGQRFDLLLTWLRYLSVSLVRLLQIDVEDGEHVYFLDRDPDYFRRLMGVFRESGPEGLSGTEGHSPGMLAELQHYDLLAEPLPMPLRIVPSSSPATRVITVECRGHRFRVTDQTWANTSLPAVDVVLDYRPRDLRAAINLLRTGGSLCATAPVLRILDDLGVQYRLAGEGARVGTTTWTPGDGAHRGEEGVYHWRTEEGYVNRKYYHPVNWSVVPETVITRVVGVSGTSLDLTTLPDLPDLLLGLVLYLPTHPYHARWRLQLGEAIWEADPETSRLHPGLYGGPELSHQDDPSRTAYPLPLGLARGNHLPLSKLRALGVPLQLTLEETGDLGVWELGVLGVLAPPGLGSGEGHDDSNRRLLVRTATYTYTCTRILSGALIAEAGGYVARIPLDDLTRIRDLWVTAWDGGRAVDGSDWITSLSLHYLDAEGEDRQFSSSDRILSGTVVPQTLLGRRLPRGLYYHSCCAEPLSERMTGECRTGPGWYLRVQSDRLSGPIRCQVRYHVDWTS